MPLWTLYDKTKPPAQAIIKEHQLTPGTASGDLPTVLDESLAWLEEHHTAQPTFDPATHKLRRDNGVIVLDPVDIRTGTRTWGWTAIELSPEELQDAIRMQKLAEEQVAVGVIAQGWLEDDAPVEANDVARVAKFIAIRDGLDAQAF
jgi:hypothetical protein